MRAEQTSSHSGISLSRGEDRHSSPTAYSLKVYTFAEVLHKAHLVCLTRLRSASSVAAGALARAAPKVALATAAF